MEIKQLRLYSKSSVGVDWTCPRKYYYNYEYEGKGIVSHSTSLQLFTGTSLHDGLAAIALQHMAGSVDIDLIGETARQQMLEALLPKTQGEVDGEEFAMEQAALVEGLLRGFYLHAWPLLMQQYPNIKMLEQPLVYKHDGVGMMAKPDIVLSDNDGINVYVEYKSTSSKKDTWINSWDTAIQLHSTVKAIEAKLGEKVESVIVQGLYKGYESYGKQSSPFCYAYKRNGNPPFTQDQYEYAYKAGFKRYPTWQLPGGVKEWVETMPSHVLAEQFPQTPPIFINEPLIEAFFKQRAIREHEILTASQLMEKYKDDPGQVQYELDRVFPQKFDQCRPSFGSPCSYLKLCHGSVQDPIAQGYSWRDTEHQSEFRKIAEGMTD